MSDKQPKTEVTHHCSQCGGPVDDDGSRDCGHLHADCITVVSPVGTESKVERIHIDNVTLALVHNPEFGQPGTMAVSVDADDVSFHGAVMSEGELVWARVQWMRELPIMTFHGRRIDALRWLAHTLSMLDTAMVEIADLATRLHRDEPSILEAAHRLTVGHGLKGGDR